MAEINHSPEYLEEIANTRSLYYRSVAARHSKTPKHVLEKLSKSKCGNIIGELLRRKDLSDVIIKNILKTLRNTNINLSSSFYSTISYHEGRFDKPTKDKFADAIHDRCERYGLAYLNVSGLRICSHAYIADNRVFNMIMKDYRDFIIEHGRTFITIELQNTFNRKEFCYKKEMLESITKLYEENEIPKSHLISIHFSEQDYKTQHLILKNLDYFKVY